MLSAPIFLSKSARLFARFASLRSSLKFLSLACYFENSGTFVKFVSRFHELTRRRKSCQPYGQTMKRIPLLIPALIVATTLVTGVHAQTNSAIVPASREGRALPRQNEVLKRAK